MQDIVAEFIAATLDRRAKAARAARAGMPPPERRPQRPGGAPVPPLPPSLATARNIAGPPTGAAPRPSAPAIGAAAGRVSAIDAVDPFAIPAPAAEATLPAPALLAAFANRAGLLAGIVLSETLAPPLALRRERDR